MNKLEYVNKLLESDDISSYIETIEKNTSISPPKDLKDKILNKCYNSVATNENINKQKNTSIFKLSFTDVMKVACFALIITLCTELFMNATYASTKENNTQLKSKNTIYKISDKIDNAMKSFSNFMLNYDLKGE